LSSYLDQETANLSKETFSVFESNCHLFLPVYPLIGRGNPVKCLAQGHNKSDLAGLASHYPSFVVNVKQESCEYQFLKSFGLTRPGNRGCILVIWIVRSGGGEQASKVGGLAPLNTGLVTTVVK